VSLDRQSIEKKDFPIARRGYDPDAVDAHLEQLAAEVERLQRQAASAAAQAPAGSSAPAPSSPASIAVAASESVRAIVEAAETSAVGIEAFARDEADRIRREAEGEARSTRDEAVAKNQAQVGAVGEATSLMLQRVDAMEGEIGALIENLRTGANRLGADLSLLQGNLGELYDAAGASEPARPRTVESMPLAPRPAPTSTSAPEPPAAAPAPKRSLPPIPEEAPDPSPHVEAPMIPPGLFEATDAEVRSDPDVAAPASGEVDVDGARLIALNMALNGATRDETDVYLRDNFDLPDRAALVDEAFTTVEG
jgi:DivIVA domain-containing protein